MRSYQFRRSLLERDQVLAFQKKMFHRVSFSKRVEQLTQSRQQSTEKPRPCGRGPLRHGELPADPNSRRFDCRLGRAKTQIPKAASQANCGEFQR